MLTVSDIREEFARLRRSGKEVAGTLEMVGISFIADEPSIFGKVNESYIERELEWYASESLNVFDMSGNVPNIWRQISSIHGRINSNYGYLAHGAENGYQLQNVLKHLVQDQNTRRATAIYTRPTIHSEWNQEGMRDFICTNAVQYLIRDGQLHLVVQMRSNDVVFGYRNDYAWQVDTQRQVIEELHKNGVLVTPGHVYWSVASLHVYERHFPLIDSYMLHESARQDVPT